MSKALLIKSQIDKNGGEVGKWNNFNNAPSYIQGIHTGKMLEDISAEKLGKSRKTKRDGCEKRNAFFLSKTKCASNLIRKATVHLQNQSKTPSFF